MNVWAIRAETTHLVSIGWTDTAVYAPVDIQECNANQVSNHLLVKFQEFCTELGFGIHLYETMKKLLLFVVQICRPNEPKCKKYVHQKTAESE